MFSKNILKPSIVQGITPMILLVCLGTKVADANKKVYLYKKLGKSLGKDPTQDGANKPGFYDTRAFGEKVLRANGYRTLLKSKLFGDYMIHRPCTRPVATIIRKQLGGKDLKIVRECGRYCDDASDDPRKNTCRDCKKRQAQQPTHFQELNEYEKVYGTNDDENMVTEAYEAYCRMIRDEIQGKWTKGQEVEINMNDHTMSNIKDELNIEEPSLNGKITKVKNGKVEIIVTCTDGSGKTCKFKLGFPIGEPCLELVNETVGNANFKSFSDFKKDMKIFNLIKIEENPSYKDSLDVYLGSDITQKSKWDPMTQKDSKNVLRSILGQTEGDDNSEYYLQHTDIKDFDVHYGEYEQSVSDKDTSKLATIEEEDFTPGANEKPTPKNSRVAAARNEIIRNHKTAKADMNASFQSMKNLIKRAAVQHSRESDPVRADMLLGCKEVKFRRRRRMMRSLSRLVQSEMKMSA